MVRYSSQYSFHFSPATRVKDDLNRGEKKLLTKKIDTAIAPQVNVSPLDSLIPPGRPGNPDKN